MILHGFTWCLMILHPQKLFDKAKSSIPKSITMLRDHDKHDLKVFLRSRSILIILVDAATLSHHQLPIPKSHESHLGPSSPESFMDIHRKFEFLIRSWTRWVWPVWPIGSKAMSLEMSWPDECRKCGIELPLLLNILASIWGLRTSGEWDCADWPITHVPIMP